MSHSKEIIIPNCDYTEEEYEKIKNRVKLDRDTYRDFRDNLQFFWESYELARGSAVLENRVRFFGEGLTTALVFRCEALIEGTAESHVRVMKYDMAENIEKEIENFKNTVHKGEEIYPGLEVIIKLPRKKAILPMKSANDSSGADSSYSVIEFLWQKYKSERNHLFHRGSMIAEAIEQVYEGLFHTFYRIETGLHFVEGKSLYEYYYPKVNLKKLNPKADEHRSYFEASCKYLGEDVSIYETFLNPEVSYRPLETGHAIHGDLNPFNILLAVKNKKTEIRPMLIDFFEIKFVSKDDWCPLLHDFARLESQIVFYYFHFLYEEETDKTEASFRLLLSEFEKLMVLLNSGEYRAIQSSKPENLNSDALKYIFRILYSLRKFVIENCPDENIEEYYANYIYAAMSFSFFFLKFTSENGMEIKRHFALKAAFVHRRTLESLSNLKFFTLFRMRKVDRLSIDDSLLSFLEEEKDTYLPPEDEIEAILDFLKKKEKQFLILEGVPGVGKTSLSKYMSLFLNAEIPEKSLEVDTFCLPFFFGSDKNLCNEREIYPVFSRKLLEAFPVRLPEELENSLDESKKFFKILNLVYHEHLKDKSQLIFWFDAINEYEGLELKNVISNIYPSDVRLVVSTRPGNEKLRKFLKSTKHEYMEIKHFSETELIHFFERNEMNLEEDVYRLIFQRTGGLQVAVKVIYEMLLEEEGKPAKLHKETLKEDLQNLHVSEDDYSGLYEFYLKINENIRAKSGEKDIAKRLLLTLSLAHSPLSIEQLYRINLHSLKAKLSEFEEDALDELRSELQKISEIVLKDESGRYRLFHPTFEEFLREKYKQSLEKVIEGFCAYLLSYADYPEGTKDFLYCIQFGGVHLYEWAEKYGERYKEALHTLFLSVLNLEEEQHKIWKKMLGESGYFIVLHRNWKEEFIFKNLLSSLKTRGLSSQAKYQFAELLGSMGKRVEDFGFKSSWSLFYFEDSLNIRKELIALEPDRTDFKRDYASSLFFLSFLLYEAGENEKGTIKTEEALMIAESLLQKEPEHIKSAILLFGFYVRLFSLSKENEFLSKALQTLQPFYEAERLPQEFLELYETLKKELET